MLVRKQIVALAVTLGWFAVAGGALAAFTPDVSRFLPGSCSPAQTTPPPPAAAAHRGRRLAAYVAGLSVLAARTTLRHDIA